MMTIPEHMKMTPKKTDYICIREKQVNKHETDIAGLKLRADFKEEQIKEIKKDIKEVSDKLDTVGEKLDNWQHQSEQDDFNIDRRVTQLETTQNTLKWVIGLGLTCIGTAVAILTFFLTILH